jgi:riboflavin synthase
VFTGIIRDVGRVAAAERRGDLLVVRVEAPATAAELPLGGSVAVNGCCLTAVSVADGSFSLELTPETLRRTAFGERLLPGARVNLELPMRADGRFDGHIVQGHVDGVGRIVELLPLGESAEMVVAPPPELERYLVPKGSVGVDGISLTIAALERGRFTIALIPFTLAHTTLGGARAGDPVNLEADVIAKYVERLLAASAERSA